MPTIRIACACLLIAGTAAAQQVGRNQYGIVVITYQVKADFAGEAFGCLRPQDTNSFYEGMQEIKRQAQAGADPEALDSATEHINGVWSRATEAQLCAHLTVSGKYVRWDSDEEHPELVGIRNDSRFGALSKRTYWTRLEWLEPAG